jgi:hypothetical protein
MWQRLARSFALLFLAPAMALAQTADLRTAMESGNGIIMYVCGTLVAVGLVSAGIAHGMGRHGVAKAALVGALISGAAFPIVKAYWGNVGLTTPEVSAFAP